MGWIQKVVSASLSEGLVLLALEVVDRHPSVGLTSLNNFCL